MPQSIRWRLPLSYAAIALLAALALGAVLLFTLRNYYLQRELDYLRANADAFSPVMASIVEANLPMEAVQSQLKSFAFLSQTQVRMLDATRRLVADSGSPGQQRDVVALSIRSNADPTLTPLLDAPLSPPEAPQPPGASKIQLESGDTPFSAGVQVKQDVEILSSVSITGGANDVHHYKTFIVLEDSSAGTIITETRVITTNASLQLPSNTATYIGHPGLILRVDQYPGIDGLFNQQPGLVASMPGLAIPYGASFFAETSADDRRSDQVVRQPFFGPEGKILGFVELSNGPAYGRQILNSVARGWAIASTIAVLLAAGVGWLISRSISTPLLALAGTTARMAGGDLSARADVTRHDELGLLAHSYNEMAGQVEETVLALRRFVADAAHELHTPLTALRTNLDLMQAEIPVRARQDFPGSPHTIRLTSDLLFLEQAQAQVERLEKLISGLLDLSRIEAGRMAEDFNSIDLLDWLAQASETYASWAEQAGLACEIVLPPLPRNAIQVHGSQTHLRRALDNLVDNAVKFTPEGGYLGIGARQAESGVEIWVTDTGIGIPANDLSQLFSRFHRGRNAAGYPGSGLGLAIVKAIVEAHGGQVAARNNDLGVGSCFIIHLPATGQG
ncbi:MAG: HAMP domain-containing histidine kinase [Chloroflexi bacterium]|nr:HAMP domain-containing histidine kinase [Chloroflexota bacterium]